MNQIFSLLHSLKEKLERVAPKTAEWEVGVILRHVTGKSWAEIYSEGVLGVEEIKLVEEFVGQRVAGDPLGYVLGTAPFRERELRVGPGVLIPRIETELLVEAAVEAARTDFVGLERVQVLDLGTGSGCIALAVAEAEPRARVDAVEFATEALRYANINLALSPVCERVKIIPLDYLKESWAAKLKPAYQLILANPPYVSQLDWESLPTEVKVEPHRALVAGPAGDEVLKWIIEHGREHLAAGGKMILEIGIGQAKALKRFAESFAELRCVKIIADHQDIERIFVIQKLLN